MSKAKGTYYENKLVKDFIKLGYEAWKVPLSGAIGENKSCVIPDRVRQYLVGDICVSINGKDRPIEVKYRSTGVPFQTIYRVKDTTCYYIHTDCILIPTLQNLCEYLNNKRVRQVVLQSGLLNSTLLTWMDHCDILALRSSKSKEWYFIVRNI